MRVDIDWKVGLLLDEDEDDDDVAILRSNPPPIPPVPAAGDKRKAPVSSTATAKTPSAKGVSGSRSITATEVCAYHVERQKKTSGSEVSREASSKRQKTSVKGKGKEIRKSPNDIFIVELLKSLLELNEEEADNFLKLLPTIEDCQALMKGDSSKVRGAIAQNLVQAVTGFSYLMKMEEQAAHANELKEALAKKEEVVAAASQLNVAVLARDTLLKEVEELKLKLATSEKTQSDLIRHYNSRKKRRAKRASRRASKRHMRSSSPLCRGRLFYETSTVG